MVGKHLSVCGNHAGQRLLVSQFAPCWWVIMSANYSSLAFLCCKEEQTIYLLCYSVDRRLQVCSKPHWDNAGIAHSQVGCSINYELCIYDPYSEYGVVSFGCIIVYSSCEPPYLQAPLRP